jgi:hypothetical protein
MEKDWLHYNEEESAIARAEKEGILVLTVGNEKYKFDGMGRLPLSDPDQAASYTCGTMFCGNHKGASSDILQIPMGVDPAWQHGDSLQV